MPPTALPAPANPSPGPSIPWALKIPRSGQCRGQRRRFACRRHQGQRHVDLYVGRPPRRLEHHRQQPLPASRSLGLSQVPQAPSNAVTITANAGGSFTATQTFTWTVSSLTNPGTLTNTDGDTGVSVAVTASPPSGSGHLYRHWSAQRPEYCRQRPCWHEFRNRRSDSGPR